MAENPILEGVLFEMLFFARIKQMPGPLKLTTSQGEDIEWSRCEVESFDPADAYEAGEKTKERVCLKPVAWNQGGYDAVIVDRSSKLVRFVQVTSRETHDLKLRYFSDCLDSLSIQGWEQWKLEIVFVVPKDNVERFRVSNVEDEDTLSRYGWRGARKGAKCAWSGLTRDHEDLCEDSDVNCQGMTVG